VALDHRRKLRRRPGSLSSLAGYEELVPVELDPSAPLEQSEMSAHVRRAVSTLSESYREVVVLKYLDGHSYQEIADLLGVSVNAIESRLHRARRMLRGKLQGFARRSGMITPESG
jgi:RNA polymerase sigma factor (sigma-70 family)